MTMASAIRPMARSTKMDRSQRASRRRRARPATAAPRRRRSRTGSVWLKKVPITLKRIAWRSGSGAPHSALISRQRRTPTKICRKVTANREPDPAQARNIEARGEFGQIDLAQREIQQRRGDQNFRVESRIRRISRVRGLRGGKQRKFGAMRRTSPPWYGFKASLAIAAPLGIAAPSTRRVKRPRRNGRRQRCQV